MSFDVQGVIYLTRQRKGHSDIVLHEMDISKWPKTWGRAREARKIAGMLGHQFFFADGQVLETVKKNT